MAFGSRAERTPPKLKQRQALRGCFGPREYYAETHRAIAGLVLDRSAVR